MAVARSDFKKRKTRFTARDTTSKYHVNLTKTVLTTLAIMIMLSDIVKLKL